jgi:hypothetical protein
MAVVTHSVGYRSFYEPNPGNTWIVDFSDGYVDIVDKTGDPVVRAVR